MIVFIEGADGTGKTTLYNALIKEGYDKIHIDSSDIDYVEWDTFASMAEDNIVVSDRACFISDLAYRILDGKHRKGMPLYDMCRLLENHEIKIIYCNTLNAFELATKRGEDLITDLSTHVALQNIYDLVIKMLSLFTNVPIFYYDWRKNSCEDVIEFIEGGKTNDTVSV